MRWAGFASEWSWASSGNVEWVGASLALRDNLLALGFPYIEAVHLAFGMPYE